MSLLSRIKEARGVLREDRKAPVDLEEQGAIVLIRKFIGSGPEVQILYKPLIKMYFKDRPDIVSELQKRDLLFDKTGVFQ